MRHIMIWLALVLSAGLAAGAPAAAQDLSVMSVNVRYPGPQDGENRWEARRNLLVDVIRDAAPDLIGTQELFQLQGDYITERLPAYAWFGVDRRGGHGDEHMGIFYRRDRLTLLESGQIWLSDQPDVPGSISWGHPFPRTLAWGLFETRDGRRFRLYDTHFPYRPEDDGARTKAARLIADRIAADDGLPAILTGDFNAGAGSDAHALLNRQLYDVWQFAPQIDGPTPGHHGFLGGTPTRRIDWILLRGFAVTQARAIAAHRNGSYPSDHYPIMADLRWID